MALSTSFAHILVLDYDFRNSATFEFNSVCDGCVDSDDEFHDGLDELAIAPLSEVFDDGTALAGAQQDGGADPAGFLGDGRAHRAGGA